jgi:uncharacterized protein YdhG (YjbR/CyaY superfamily)
MQPTYTNIDEYIALCDENVRGILERLRQTIHDAAPDAVEKISYGMPAFWQGRNLVYFAACKNHIGLYPGAQAMEHFAPRFAGYKTSKGAVQLPLSKPMPYELVAEITRWRVDAVVGTAKTTRPVRKAGQ